MSRTREYKVLVSENFLQREKIGVSNIIEDEGFETSLNGIKTFKATLIIELPSPKITISEEEFDKAFKFIARPDWLMTFEGFELGKEKLFKNAE